MENNRKYTVEEIEELKKKDISELTPQERRLVNLRPMRKGERSRNPKGRPVGIPSWSHYFKKFLNDEDFLNTVVSALPRNWEGIVEKTPASVIAAGLIAVATREVSKKVAGDEPIDEKTLRLIDRIKDIGYGDKITHEVENNGFFDHDQIIFQVIDPKKKTDEE